jgi:DNA-binding NarL/FixJ family response regulator
MTTRVLVVEDHPVFRDGLAALVSSLPDMVVTGSVADGEAAMAAVGSGGVDVVLMDLNLPGMSGIEATGQIARRPSPPGVLIVTMVDDDDTVMAALRAGARGYVLKGATGDEIAAAVRTVAGGGAVFGAGVAAQVLLGSAAPEAKAAQAVGSPTGAADVVGLTDREREVLALIAEGSSNAQIARALGLTVKTVQNYVSRILDKLHVADRTQAALYASGRLPRP